MIEIPDKQYFNPREVARYMEEELRTVYYWIAIGRIKHLKRGKKIKVERDELVRAMTKDIL